MEEKQEKIKKLVTIWERARLGRRIKFLDDWRRKNNLIVYGSEEFPHESYLYALKIIKDFIRIKMRTDTKNWLIDSVSKLGRRRGSQSIFLRIYFVLKEIGNITGNWDISWNSVRIDQDYNMEKRKTRRELIPYVKASRSKGKTAYLL
jgi:hypothetical protein